MKLSSDLPDMPARIDAGNYRLTEGILGDLARGISPGLNRGRPRLRPAKTTKSPHHFTVMTHTCVSFL